MHLEVIDWDFVGEKEKGRSQTGEFKKQIANKKPMVWNYNKKQIEHLF